MAVSTIGTSGIADANVTTAKLAASSALVGKNLIQNGAMTLSQRGTAAGADNHFSLDRWYWTQSSGDVCTKSQDTSVVPAGSGFKFSHKTDVTTAGGGPGAADFNITEQRIEAQNLQHLLYGVAGAKTLVASFWFRSPKSGTHCVALYQPDATRSYVREFTVAVADTYEYFTMTFPGDTGGTITNDTGAGLHLVFPMNVGSNFQVAANQWAAGQDYATTNQQNLLDNTANNIYITGVQLEIGSVATDFEHEPISATLAKCKRYYERHTFDSVSGQQIAVARIQTAASTILGFKFDVEKRVDPTFTFTAAATFSLQYNGTTSSALAAISADHITTTQCRIVPGLSSGLTADEAAMWQRDGTDATYMEISADL